MLRAEDRKSSNNEISDENLARLTCYSNPPTDEKPLSISNDAYTLLLQWKSKKMTKLKEYYISSIIEEWSIGKITGF